MVRTDAQKSDRSLKTINRRLIYFPDRRLTTEKTGQIVSWKKKNSPFSPTLCCVVCVCVLCVRVTQQRAQEPKSAYIKHDKRALFLCRHLTSVICKRCSSHKGGTADGSWHRVVCQVVNWRHQCEQIDAINAWIDAFWAFFKQKSDSKLKLMVINSNTVC